MIIVAHIFHTQDEWISRFPLFDVFNALIG